MRRTLTPLTLLLGATMLIGSCATSAALSEDAAISSELMINDPGPGERRAIVTDDLVLLRDIDTLRVSPDGSRFAILVRQAAPEENTYRTAWFVGSAQQSDALVNVGDGGDARQRESANGRINGGFAGNIVRWSPDGSKIAYTARHDGEVQIWVSDLQRGTQRQITHNGADIRDLVWSEDGASIIFSVGQARAELDALDEAGRRGGFLLEEFQFFAEIVSDPRPNRPLQAETPFWRVGANGAGERLASAEEQAAFARLSSFQWGRSQAQGADISDMSGAAAPPVRWRDGRAAWLGRDTPAEDGPMPMLRLNASLTPNAGAPVRCAHEECTSQMFSKVWWSEDGEEVIFWRKHEANAVENTFYAWSPATGALRTIYHRDGDEFRECDLSGGRLICVREQVDRPMHVAAIDTNSGALTIVADANPEFQRIELGRTERFSWTAAEDRYRLGYPSALFGYIIYPPNFDPSRQYPVFIAPYGAPGFRRGDVGDEHPLYVYAANGMVVISSMFPVPLDGYRHLPTLNEAIGYDPARGYPHLTIFADSTWAALDAVAARGFIDRTRIGIGGVSHGSFVPGFMMLQHDRIAALAVAGPSWSQYEYYAATRTARRLHPSVWPESREFWAAIDMADHVEEIEAPMLVNYADGEFFHDWRLPRSMENGGRAYEARVFPNETHVKWQSAHRQAIYNTNLDWFRFWLQDVEDSDPAKAAQYERWRNLRALQCRNPRSVRDYCGASSEAR